MVAGLREMLFQVFCLKMTGKQRMILQDAYPSVGQKTRVSRYWIVVKYEPILLTDMVSIINTKPQHSFAIWDI